MIAKSIKRVFSILVCAMLVVCTTVICNAAGSKLKIKELDDMTVQLPDNMLGITRDSESTDKYFSVFGLDYDKTMTDFKSSDIYMQAMDNRATTTVTVTMTSNSDSEGIKNYNLLSEEKLYKVRDNFISQGEYISCTPDQVDEIIWLLFDLNVSNGDSKIKAFQANTVYDGMSINVTIQHNGGNVTSADYQTLQSIISTINFTSKADPNGSFTAYVYIGIIVLVIVLFIIVMLAGKGSKKKIKKSKNEQILRELTDKYKTDKTSTRKTNTDIVNIHNSYEELNEYENDSYNAQDLNDYYKDTDEEEKVKIYEKPSVSDDEIAAIVSESKARFKAEENSVEMIEKEETFEEEPKSNEAVVQEPTYSVENIEENVLEAFDDEEDFELEDEEELRKEAEKNTVDDFDDGYDFFEEKPRRIVGIIDVDSSDLKNAVDYDVLSEEEKRAVEVETSSDKEKTDSFIEVAEKIGVGIKNFFVHCGYFCTNVTRLIKRKHNAKKRRKAELERRERERIRRQQAAARRDKNGLVKVHSATQRPQSQQRNQAMRKAPSRRPQQQNNNRRK